MVEECYEFYCYADCAAYEQDSSAVVCEFFPAVVYYVHMFIDWSISVFVITLRN